MFTFIAIIKNIFSHIINFFNTKVGKIVSIILVTIFSLWYANYRGFKDGILYQEAKYQENLKIALKEQAIKQNEAIKQNIEVAKQETKIITVYKDRVKTIKEYVDKNPSPANCVMNSNEFKEYMKLLEEVK